MLLEHAGCPRDRGDSFGDCRSAFCRKIHRDENCIEPFDYRISGDGDIDSCQGDRRMQHEDNGMSEPDISGLLCDWRSAYRKCFCGNRYPYERERGGRKAGEG